MSVSVEAYFAHLRDIRGSGAGVAETSYYGPLAELLNAEGHRLKLVRFTPRAAAGGARA